MPMKSTPERYGRVPAAIHWLSALAVIVMLASGLTMGNFDDAEQIAAILPVHVATGMVLALLTVLRIVWWLAIDRQPAPPAGLGTAQVWASRIVHLGIYLALVVMLSSGVTMVLLSGALPAIFGGGPLPDFSELPPYEAHELVSRVLLVLAIAHIGAALWHQFIRRDHLIARMGFRG